MASRKSFLSKPSYIFQSTRTTPKSSSQGDAILELDEADLWNNFSVANNNSSNNKKGFSSSSSSSSSCGLKRGSSRKVVHHDHHHQDVAAATSLPVNIPDWSKILKQEYKEHRKWESDDEDDHEDDDEEDDYNGGGVRVPPHEYLAKTRGASLSVHEGIGRTLKGRDLRSVRNAIWKKVGFED